MGDLRYEQLFSLIEDSRPLTALSFYVDPERYYSTTEIRIEIRKLLNAAGFESMAERFSDATEDLCNIYGVLVVASAYVNIERCVNQETGEECSVKIDDVGWVTAGDRVAWKYNGKIYSTKEDAMEARYKDKMAVERQKASPFGPDHVPLKCV